MPGGTAEFPQGHLQFLGVGHARAAQHLMHRSVLRQEGQSVEGLEAAERQATPRAEPVAAQRRFMHQLQRQARFDPLGGLLRPGAEQVPRPQPQVFCDQQPEARHVVADLIGQPLADAAFNAPRIAFDVLDQFVSEPRLDGFAFRPGAEPVEFFFAGRTRPAPFPRCGC